jgi:hypothetical protein
MPVQIDLPPEIEQRLRAQSPDLNAEAREAMLIELYRQNKITHRELGSSLGLDRFQTDELLKKHHVTEDLPTEEEYAAALRRLNVPHGR